MREYLDLLLEVSEQTGIAWLVLHHVGKTKEGHGDERQQGRGASAIFDAWGAVLDLTRETDSTRKVAMTKPHPEAAGPIEPFFIEVVDVPSGTDPRAGVLIRHKTVEQVHPPNEGMRVLNSHVERVLAAVASHGGTASAIDQIVAWAELRKDAGRLAVKEALTMDVLVRRGSARAP